VNDIAKAISALEHQRATIDHAIAALREVEALAPPPNGRSSEPSKPGRKSVKRRMSAEGRKRISEAAKKRWAEKKAAEAAPPRKKRPSTKKTSRRGTKKATPAPASA
jgi:hypothetical protein